MSEAWGRGGAPAWPRADFGVNIACCRADYPLAKACCASVREHLRDIPVCLFVDGDFSVDQLQRAYDVHVIRVHEIADPALRALSIGYGVTKMFAFWHSPFERFLYLDADTILWGNPLERAFATQADIVINEPHEAYTEFILRSQYFDYERVFELTETFEWKDRPLFNAGVFVARRGLIDRDEYLELLALKHRDHSLLLCGDQGILNLLVFRGASQGRFTVATAPLQAVVPVIDRAELERRFPIVGGRPAIEPAGSGVVIHWAGAKPYTFHHAVYRAPVTHYRRRFLNDSRHLLAWLWPVLLWIEEWRADYRVAMPPALRDVLRRIRRAIVRLRGRASAALASERPTR